MTPVTLFSSFVPGLSCGRVDKHIPMHARRISGYRLVQLAIDKEVKINCKIILASIRNALF
jgi:hypothetical protein